jgi:hypothetical protein
MAIAAAATATAEDAATETLYCHALEIQCSPYHSLQRTSGITVHRWCATGSQHGFERLREMQQLTALGSGQQRATRQRQQACRGGGERREKKRDKVSAGVAPG